MLNMLVLFRHEALMQKSRPTGTSYSETLRNAWELFLENPRNEDREDTQLDITYVIWVGHETLHAHAENETLRWVSHPI